MRNCVNTAERSRRMRPTVYPLPRVMWMTSVVAMRTVSVLGLGLYIACIAQSESVCENPVLNLQPLISTFLFMHRGTGNLLGQSDYSHLQPLLSMLFMGSDIIYAKCIYFRFHLHATVLQKQTKNCNVAQHFLHTFCKIRPIFYIGLPPHSATALAIFPYSQQHFPWHTGASSLFIIYYSVTSHKLGNRNTLNCCSCPLLFPAAVVIHDVWK